MNKQLCIFAFLLFALCSNWSFAQSAKPEWLYIIDGYNDTFVSDLEVDKEGNTYLAINYCGALTVSGLNKKMPPSGHVHGLLIKLNKNGKPLWAHGFKSAYDNRINDLSIAPDGDVLITGFGDGVMSFPGLSDTLKCGKEREKWLPLSSSCLCCALFTQRRTHLGSFLEYRLGRRNEHCCE